MSAVEMSVPEVRRPQPIVRPFKVLDHIDKAREIYRLARQGMTARKIGAELGVEPATIIRIAREEGINIHTRTLIEKNAPSIAKGPSRDPYSWGGASQAKYHWRRLTRAARAQRIAIGAAPPPRAVQPVVNAVTLIAAPRCAANVEALPAFHTQADIIIAEVADKHFFGVAEMKGKTRAKALVAARHEAFYRLKHETPMSLPKIGRKFGGLHHTTVLHGIRKHEARVLGTVPIPRREPVWGEGGWH